MFGLLTPRCCWMDQAPGSPPGPVGCTAHPSRSKSRHRGPTRHFSLPPMRFLESPANPSDGDPCASDGDSCASDGDPCASDGDLCASDGDLCASDGDLCASDGAPGGTDGDACGSDGDACGSDGDACGSDGDACGPSGTSRRRDERRLAGEVGED